MARAKDETVAGAVAPGSIVRVSDERVGADAETVAGPIVPASLDSLPTMSDVGARRSPSAAAAPPGMRVAGYVLDEFLADGGFGVVYRAHDEATGEQVAVKILHAELAESPDLVLRFEREVEAIRRVKHPNVIDVYARGRLADGRPYFAMELLHGVSLEDHLRVRGRLPAGEVLSILEPLCSALAAAHERSIVHRDIKGSNVFLATVPSGRRVVLLDFGVAKLLDAEGPALTKSRHVVGTLACMAPEQLLGRPVDARTDIYALGALTFCMLTGEQPFADSPFSVLHQMHLHARPPRPSSVARVSPSFDDPVLQAMAKDPAARFATVGAFLEEIRAAVARSRAAVTIPEMAAAPGVIERRALGVYIELLVDAAALDAADEHLLSDMEAVLPICASELSVMGFAVAVETGTSMLLVLNRPESSAADEVVRRAAVQAALSLGRKLGAREGRDEAVRVFICVHAGALLVSHAGTLVGGGLLELSTWVPEATAEGVFASPPALADLGIAGDPPADRGSFSRIAEAPTP